jgi:hypothetical protein
VSLEQLLQDNLAAVQANTKALAANTAVLDALAASHGLIRMVQEAVSPAPPPVAPKTFEDVKAALLRCAGAKGAVTAKAVLQGFDAERAQDLPPERYAEAVEAFAKAEAA